MPQNFPGPRLKIKRAEKHIAELQAALEAFQQSSFCELSVNDDLQAGKSSIGVKVLLPLPDEVPVLIGDAIHNLRSAIDVMYCDVYRYCGLAPPKSSAFPFSKDRQELKDRCGRGEIKLLPPTFVDLMIDKIKPYEGGNQPLRTLNKLSNLDKHSLVTPVLQILSVTGVNAHTPGGLVLEDCAFSLQAIQRPGEIGGYFAAIDTDPGLQVTSYDQPTCSILFGDGPAEGESILPTLVQSRQLVSEIVDLTEHCLNDHFAPKTP